MMYDPNDIIFLDFFWLLSYNRETGVTIVTIIITFSKFCHSLVVSITDCGAKGQQ